VKQAKGDEAVGAKGGWKETGGEKKIIGGTKAQGRGSDLYGGKVKDAMGSGDVVGGSFRDERGSAADGGKVVQAKGGEAEKGKQASGGEKLQAKSGMAKGGDGNKSKEYQAQSDKAIGPKGGDASDGEGFIMCPAVVRGS
jgi:hypothetical protein